MKPTHLALAACALLAACRPDTTVTGAVQSTSAALGSWTLAPTQCMTGTDAAFYGVDLGDGAHALRVVDDALKGYVVTLAPDGDPNDPRVWLSPTSGCARFDAEVSGTDDQWGALSGRVQLDCALDGGGHIGGEIAFDHCYDPYCS
jgi:hypothetical protein